MTREQVITTLCSATPSTHPLPLLPPSELGQQTTDIYKYSALGCTLLIANFRHPWEYLMNVQKFREQISRGISRILIKISKRRRRERRKNMFPVKSITVTFMFHLKLCSTESEIMWNWHMILPPAGLSNQSYQIIPLSGSFTTYLASQNRTFRCRHPVIDYWVPSLSPSWIADSDFPVWFIKLITWRLRQGLRYGFIEMSPQGKVRSRREGVGSLILFSVSLPRCVN